MVIINSNESFYNRNNRSRHYYLSKFLLEKDYEVHGVIRRTSNFNTDRIDPLISKYKDNKKLKLYYSDLLDPSSITSLISGIEPNEVYNLAAQSHVAVSFKNPNYSISTSTTGTTTLLEAVKNAKNEIKFYQASSSEMLYELAPIRLMKIVY